MIPVSSLLSNSALVRATVESIDVIMWNNRPSSNASDMLLALATLLAVSCATAETFTTCKYQFMEISECAMMVESLGCGQVYLNFNRILVHSPLQPHLHHCLTTVGGLRTSPALLPITQCQQPYQSQHLPIATHKTQYSEVSTD